MNKVPIWYRPRYTKPRPPLFSPGTKQSGSAWDSDVWKNMASFGDTLTGKRLIRLASEIHQQMKHTKAIQQETCIDYLTLKMKALQTVLEMSATTPPETWHHTSDDMKLQCQVGLTLGKHEGCSVFLLHTSGIQNVFCQRRNYHSSCILSSWFRAS